jgi:BASS family bile acid:Na+ symporter
MVAAGFLILAVCPGAPYGPPFAALARGNVGAAVGLMVILAGSSAILAPVLLQFFALLVPGEKPLEIDASKVLPVLMVTQLLPLAVGVAIRQRRPRLADWLQTPANRLSTALNVVAVGFIVVAHFDLFWEVPPRAFLGMLALLLASWCAGWVLGGPGTENRKTMTLTTSLRNVGVGLVIATGTFAGTPAVAAVLVYGLFEVAGSLLLALAWARRKGVPVGNDDVPRSAAKHGI